MSTWIKRSEREPVAADGRKIGGYWDSASEWIEFIFAGETPLPERCTHWRSIKADPPPRELTQREKDEETVKRVWDGRWAGNPTVVVQEAMLDAIHAERREVAKLVAKLFPHAPNWGKENHFSDEWKQLRARFDEQGAGK